MTGYILAQIVWCILFLLTGMFLIWRYHVKLSRPVMFRAFRQRLFALRDRAILLVAEGQFSENDPNWQKLYRTLNHSAKAANVERMKNGISFVWNLLRCIKPPDEKALQEVEKMPQPLLELWVDYVKTVLSTVWEGSVWLRLAVRLAHHSGIMKRWLEQHRPKETASYRGWVTSAKTFKEHRRDSLSTPTAVGSW